VLVRHLGNLAADGVERLQRAQERGMIFWRRGQFDRKGLEPAASRWICIQAVRRMQALARNSHRVPFLPDGARLASYGTAEQPRPQNLQGETSPDTESGAGAGGGALALPRALHHGLRAAQHRLGAPPRRVSISRSEQEAELTTIRAAFPDYAAIHSHVLHDVLARLDKTYQAFFRRLKRVEGGGSGKKTKTGFPRFKGRNRYHAFTFKESGHGAQLDNGFLVLSKIGRIGVHWSRPLEAIEGTPKTVTVSREAAGWYVAVSCAEVPLHPLPQTGQETDGYRPGAGLLRHPGRRHDAPHPALLSHRRGVPAPPAAASGGWRAAKRAALADAKPSSCSPRRT
jgi:hypothetical protein